MRLSRSQNRGFVCYIQSVLFLQADHNTPTTQSTFTSKDLFPQIRLNRSRGKCKREHGISHWGLATAKNGYVTRSWSRIWGITQPGATIGCGDSQYVKRHCAFWANASGSGTSEGRNGFGYTNVFMQTQGKKCGSNVSGN